MEASNNFKKESLVSIEISNEVGYVLFKASVKESKIREFITINSEFLLDGHRALLINSRGKFMGIPYKSVNELISELDKNSYRLGL